MSHEIAAERRMFVTRLGRYVLACLSLPLLNFEHSILGQSTKPKPKTLSVELRVKKIIVEQLGVDEDKVVPKARFVEDLGADSLDTVELVMAFEEAFDIEIPDDDAEKIRTVQDAIDYIKAHMKPPK